ncbi:MAG: chorismate synthase [Lentisphaerae bacterium]|nr:chorismate synthase [Lentisphaerota bacterium]
MSGNSFGNIFRITTFGESHGEALGVVIDGMPSGVKIDREFLAFEMSRRRPGQSQLTTSRSEADAVEILSGVLDDVSTGTPLAMVIRNTSQRSKDYRDLENIFRPGHADFGFFSKYGIRDVRGGGRSSGRETCARVAAGAVAKMMLASYGIKICAYAKEIGGIKAETFDIDEIEKNPARSPDPIAAEKMMESVALARAENDSVGGRVNCFIDGVPAGWGEPVFDKLDARLAAAMLSLGSVKGIEFGEGFAVTQMKGSENNDPMRAGKKFASNHAGGILGGISTGERIEFSIAVKPTPSIAQKQNTVDKNGEEQEIVITGRHDPCIVPRIIPVVEAMAAIVLADFALLNRCAQINKN